MYRPKSPSEYQGNQVILNAKEDAILLYSKESIGFSTHKNFHFDTNTSEGSESKFIINSPKIYLGLQSNDELADNSAVLGDELEDILERICTECIGILDDIHQKVSYICALEGEETEINPNNKTMLQNRKEEFETIIEDLKSIKSTKVLIGDNSNQED
jgi:hypothetical protein